MPKRAEPTGFAGRLKELRGAAGLNQDELAIRSGLYKFSIAKLEQGVRESTWATVLALASALGVDVGAFAVAPAEDTASRARGRPRKAAERAERAERAEKPAKPRAAKGKAKGMKGKKRKGG